MRSNVITESDLVGVRFVGYFSKERQSPKDFAPSLTSMGVPVTPSTWLAVAFSLCFGTTPGSLPGASPETRSLKTSRTVSLTLTLGELPFLLDERFVRYRFLPDFNRTSPPRSRFSNLGSVIFGTLQSSSTSPSVVIVLAQTSTMVTMEELVLLPLRTMLTTNVRYPLQSFFFGPPLMIILATVSQIKVNYISVYLLNVERLNTGCIGDLMR